MLVSFDGFNARQSYIDGYIQSKFASRLTTPIAIPVFAAADMAYHGTAVVLKGLRVVLLKLSGRHQCVNNDFATHVMQMRIAAYASVAYPILAIVNIEKLHAIHDSIRVTEKKGPWKPVCVAAIVGLIGITALAMYALPTAAQKRTVHVLHSPRLERINPLTNEFSLNGGYFSAISNGLFIFGAYQAISRTKRRHGYKAAFDLACRVLTIRLAIHVFFSLAEWTAQAKLYYAGVIHGPSHWTWRVSDMAEQVERLSGDPEFLASVTARGVIPDVSELSIGEAGSLPALRQLFGAGRTLSRKGVRDFYHKLLERLSMDAVPLEPRDQEFYAAAVSRVRTASRLFTRESGPFLDHLAAMIRDMWKYGHWHGPSYIQTVAGMRDLSLGEMVQKTLEKAQRSNAFFNAFAS